MKRSKRAVLFDGNLLRELREQKKMSVREFASLCKVGYVQISRYEKGGTIPSSAILKRLVDNLSLQEDYFSKGMDLDIVSLREGMLQDFDAMKKSKLNADQIRAIRSVIKVIKAAIHARNALD